MSAATPSLNLDWDDFLARYWQREHCLIAGAISDWQAPLAADELAGLALEDSVESRIVTHDAGQWQLTHGPFEPADFQRDDAWTLLVQAVDHLIPEVAALRDYFRPLPTWRIDDVMVSYADDGGSVGPHFDHYDVFLLQGEGSRLWRIGQQCDETSELMQHPELRLLASFDCQQEYLLEPGDMLYIPPGVAHWGIAQGECTTFSIGFRAPRIEDMLSRRVDMQLDQRVHDQFFEDAGRARATRAGEIPAVDRERVREQVRRQLAAFDDDRWFGELVTEPRNHMMFWEPATDAAVAVAHAAYIAPALHTRLAWQESPEGKLTVFANGTSDTHDDAALDTLLALCVGDVLDGERLDAARACPASRQLLERLVEVGALYVKQGT